LFSSKSYDVLDPEDERFEVDYEQFKESIKDLDHRLAFTLSQAFGDCHNLDGVFKVELLIFFVNFFFLEHTILLILAHNAYFMVF